jgi:HK97 family phage major capsid protein
MSKVIEMRRQRAELLDQARTLADGELTEETRAQADAKIAQADQLQKDIEREERLQAMITSKVAPKHNKLPLGDDEERAFEHWIRTGDDGGIRELRASNATDMNIGTAADGQYLVPTAHYQGIIARRDEMALSPRIGVQQFVGKGTSINVPVDNEADGEFVVTTEVNDFDLDAPATDRVTLTKLLYSKTIHLSYQLLQDEDSNLMEFLTDFVGRGLAKTHNSLLITEALANGSASLTLDAAAAIGVTEIPELVYKQAGEYAEGSVWLMKRATEGYIRGLSSANSFVFNPNPAGSDRAARPEIWGFPVYNTEKMAAIGGTYKSLIFGNFAFMGMYEDPSLTFLRDPYTLSRKGQVQLHYYFRVDYGVLQAEAIHYATHPSA